jgi:hypothetical protein
LFRIVIFMYIYMSICIVCTSVRTTATGWKHLYCVY